LLLAIFVVSVIALEVILRHDETIEQKMKKVTVRKTPADSSAPESTGVLILAQAIEQHSREARRPSRTLSPSETVSSLDSSLQETSGR